MEVILFEDNRCSGMGGGTLGSRVLGLLLLQKNLHIRLTHNTLEISGRNLGSWFDKSLGLKRKIAIGRITSFTRRRLIGASIFDIDYIDDLGLVQEITLISSKSNEFHQTLIQHTDLPQHLKQF